MALVRALVLRAVVTVIETARGARGLCFACVLGRRYQLASARAALGWGPDQAHGGTLGAQREAENDAAGRR